MQNSLIGQRKGKIEAGALVQLALAPDPSVVGQDDGFGHSQTQPAAPQLQIVAADLDVFVKNALQESGRDPLPRVGHLTGDACAGQPGADQDTTARIGIFHGVGKQVVQDPFDLVRIGRNQRQVRLRLGRQRNALPAW